MTSIILDACRFAGNHRSYEGVRLLIVTLRGFQVTLSPRICRGTNGVNELRPAPTQVNAIDCKTLMLASRADTFHLTVVLTLSVRAGTFDKRPGEVATALRQLRQLQYFSFESPEQFEPWLEIFTHCEQCGEIPIRELHQLCLWWCIDLNLPLIQRLVARFPTIQELDVTMTAFGSAELEFLATSPLTKSLRKLVAANIGGITGHDLRHLVAFQNLQALDLTACGAITDAGIAHVARVTTLQSLNIGYLFLITDVALKHLSALHDLRSLDCSECTNISDQGLQWLLVPSAENGGAGCKLLQKMIFSWCEKITDAGLAVIAEVLRDSLESLSLGNCMSISVEGLLKLSGMRRLRELAITESSLVGRDAGSSALLKQTLPRVNIIT